MSADATANLPKDGIWTGGRVPMGASFGKLMMWFFLLSDAFTFSSLLISYSYFRVTASPGWVKAEEVFNGVPWIPGLEHGLPLVFVGIMTFILIMSSVTMVLAVESGHRMNRKGVVFYMFLTIIGGLMFLGCQAMEWTNLIIEEGMTMHNNPFLVPLGEPGAGQHASLLFGQLFFTITGFHGFHVFSGVVINCIMFFKAKKGDFEKVGHYEMIEKVGLYWHFVDLVWVFVFTLFYLI
ncbi:MAG: cytochrome c oxidase subunit 3 [Bacteroidetes bacterium]|nr:cytochrome c oxidase subunit 3 [Bacteroidota bacterium]